MFSFYCFFSLGIAIVALRSRCFLFLLTLPTPMVIAPYQRKFILIQADACFSVVDVSVHNRITHKQMWL